MMKHAPALGILALFALACAGPRGYTGSPGPAGMTGPPGPAGPTGSQGQPGMTASPDPAAPVTGWVTLRDILFDFDTVDIRPSEMNKISDLATYVNQNPSVRVGIDGSTDLSRGTNRYNVALSQQRIDNVRDALIRAGVAADRIETGRFGTERVECTDSTEQCSQREGRVEVMGRSS
jgi:outer membrane protein OmpA-like peptidoglycan-associated protein